MPYAILDDIKIHYRVAGDISDQTKPTFIFLHGGAGMADHSIYISFWSRLSDQVNIVFIDQRGCGKSEKGDPQKWNLEQHGKDIFSFCKVLGIKKPIVGGVSWGGYVAISYGIQYPEHPMALILCNTEGTVSKQARYEAFLRIANPEAASAVKAFDDNWNAYTNAEYFKLCLPFYAKKAYTPDELTGCIQNPELWAKYMTTEHGKFDFTPQLHKITCPVLHLAGKNDPVHPVSCAVDTARHIGENCELAIIENTGDPVYRDKPDETVEILADFIDRVFSPTSPLVIIKKDGVNQKIRENYMYKSATSSIETSRLEGHNILHNPHTLRFLSQYLTGRKNILELGCGSGTIGASVLSHADLDALYTGVDKDPAQIRQSKDYLKLYSSRAKLLCLNILTELDQLNEKAPFDFIYCRWLLVHLPKNLLVNVLKKILSLLSKNGVFLCEECDNRSVNFHVVNNAISKAPYQKVNQLWSIISRGLMDRLGNDLELTKEKLIQLLQTASDSTGIITFEGTYQVVLRTSEQKKLIVDGYHSSAHMVTAIFNETEDKIDEIVKPFEQCAADPAIQISFLQQNIVTYRKP